MKWARATGAVRLIALLVAAGCFGVAWRLTSLGASGVEDVPPPFILVAGVAGLAFLGVGIVGRYPSADG
ncbi:MAG: hypothetical protein V9E87_06110 [Gemmatimonadales bacterium]